MTVWANPIPVSVVLVPVRAEPGLGLLVVRRGIEPRKGKLALVGGFLEEHETWQVGGAREVQEETGVKVDATKLEPLWFTSTQPMPNRVLLFSVAPALERAMLPRSRQTPRRAERGLIFGPEALEDVFAFPLHIEAARMWFNFRASRGLTGSPRLELPHTNDEPEIAGAPGVLAPGALSSYCSAASTDSCNVSGTGS